MAYQDLIDIDSLVFIQLYLAFVYGPCVLEHFAMAAILSCPETNVVRGREVINVHVRARS